MAENKAEKIVLSKRRVGKAQSIMEGRITVPDGDLKKVLKTSAESIVTACEVLDKCAVVSGKTKYCAIYINDSGEYKNVELTADFNERLLDSSLIAGQSCMCRAEVVDSDISGISEGEIKIASVTDINLTVLDKTAVSYVCGCGDNIVCLKKSQTFSSIDAVSKTSFTTEFEVENKFKIEKILGTTYSVVIRKISCDGMVARIEGDIESNITYVAQGEELILKTICETVPFIEEATVSGLSSDGTFEGSALITSHKTEFSGSEFKINASVSVAIVQTTSTSIETVIDAFSSSNELNLTYETCAMSFLTSSEQVQEKINGSAEVNLQNMSLNKVIGSSIKNLMTTNIFVTEDFITVEGLANVTVFTEIGIDGSDDKTVSSVDVELPYSIRTHVYGTLAEDFVDANASLSDIIVKHKRTNEIDVSANLKLNLFIYRNENVALVKEISLGEMKAPDTAAISFYITKPGDTPFSVSKKFSMPVSEICRFNDDVCKLLQEEKELPLGTQIVVYRRKTV